MTADKKNPPRGSGKKWLVRVAVLLCLYAAAGFFVIPAVVRSQMLNRLPALTRRQAQIESVSFNPFTFSFGIAKFSLNESNGAPFTSFDDFQLRFKPLSSLFSLGWVFGDIHLERPQLHVIRQADGNFNFANLLAGTNAPGTNQSAASALPPLLVRSLSISNGAVTFEDLNRLTPFKSRIEPINFNLTNLTTIAGKTAPAILEARTDSGEEFSWSGGVTVVPPASSGVISARGIPLAHYTAYSRQLGGIGFSNGFFGVTLDYTFSSSSNGMAFNCGIATSLTNLSAQTADGHDGIALSECRSAATVSLQTFAASNQPLLLATNAGVVLKGLEIKTPFNGETVFSLASLEVTNFQFNSALNAARVGLVRTSGGKLSMRRNRDGSLNLLSLIPAAPTNNSAPVPPDANHSAAKMSAAVDDIVLDNFSVKAEDLQPGHPAKFTVDQINLHASGVSTGSNSPVAMDLGMRFQETGTIGLRGNAVLQPLSADLSIGITNLDLRCIQPYLEQQARLVLTGGSVDLNGHAVYSPSDKSGPPMRFTGNLAVNQFATTDDMLFKDFTSWDSFAINGITAQFPPAQFHADEIKFTGLRSRVTIGADGRINLQDILRANTNQPATSVAAPAPAPQPLPDISVGEFAIQGGAFHFSDKSIEPNCVVELQDFKTTVTGLSSKEDSTAVLDVTGKLDSRASFGLAGIINPLSKDVFADITASVTNMDLSAFSPYTEKFVGRPLSKGKFSCALQYTLDKKALKARNGFFIDQLKFGPRNDSTNATTLPVKLAVALLKDREGRIRLDVPLSGRMDDPKFKVGPIIMQVLGNIIGDAVTSPFSLLGSVFGGGPELSHINFAPAQTNLMDSETNKLNALARALFERPELTLEINGSVDPSTSREPLMRAILRQKVKSFWIEKQIAAGKTASDAQQAALDDSDYAGALREYYEEYVATNSPASPVGVSSNSIPASAVPQKKPKNNSTTKALVIQTIELPSDAEMESRLLETVTITPSDLRKVMAFRAAVVQDYLLKTGKVTADRLFITAPQPMTATSKGEERVNLSLD